MKKIIFFSVLSVALAAALGFFCFKYLKTTGEKLTELPLNLDDPKIEQKLRESELIFFKNFGGMTPTAEETPTNALTAPAVIKVPILTYHSIRPFLPNDLDSVKMYIVPPEIFSQQLEYLNKEKYTAISFADLANYFDSGAPLPEKPIIISLDDGWQSQFEYAFPILKKAGVTATFFIFSNAVGKERFLSWPEIKEMAAAGMEIGSHTKSHPYLFKITDESILRQEIIDSKKIIESELGQDITAFDYPFYLFNDQTIRIVKEAGYRTARSGYGGSLHAVSDRYMLKSLQVPNDYNSFVKKLSKY